LWNGCFHIRGVWEKSRQPVKPICRDRESSIRVPERSQLFIRADNETLSVAAMRVNNPDRSSAAETPEQSNVEGKDAAPPLGNEGTTISQSGQKAG
jgi:hypothetical protein